MTTRKFILFTVFCFISFKTFAQSAGSSATVPVHYDNVWGRPVADSKNYAIVSYEVSIVPKGGGDMQGPYIAKSGKMADKEASKAMARLRIGDKVIFDKIVLQELGTNHFVGGTSFSKTLE